MNVPTPKDAQQAAKQSRIHERAQTLFTEQKYSAYQNGGGSPMWSVCRPDGKAYGVNLEAETCDCPGFENDGTCKHLLGLLITLEREAAEAQCAEVERMMQACELETTGTDPHYWLDPR